MYCAQGNGQATEPALDVYEDHFTRSRVVFDIAEGRRVAIARLEIEGNTHFTDEEIVAHMKTRPEGFWWFRSGEYDDEKLHADLQERLPKSYGQRGYVDFQALGDTLVVDETTGKATLVVRVSEGEPYRVGTFEIVGNRRFATDELGTLYPFTGDTRT